MAFNSANLSRCTITNQTGPVLYIYVTADTVADVSMSDYFRPFGSSLNQSIYPFQFNVGDMIESNCSDGRTFISITSIDPVTSQAEAEPGELSNVLASGRIFVGNASNIATGVAMSGDAAMANTGALTIANSAITNAKVAAAAAIDYSKLAALASGNILVGSAGNVATSVAMSGDATISNTGALTIGAAKVSSSKVDPTLVQYIRVPMTAAQWNGMYDAPFELIPAPAAGELIVVNRAVISFTFAAAQFLLGGAVALQLGNTVHGGGILVTDTVSAVTVDAWAASSVIEVAGKLGDNLTANATGQGLFISNDTAAFTTGDGSFNIFVWYSIITA